MYNVLIKNTGDSSFAVIAKDYKFVIDTKGAGITPPDTLLAGLGSCIGVYLRKYAEAVKLDIKEFDINIKADFVESKPVCFKDIFVTIDLKGIELTETKINALMAFIKNCPVHNTLKNNPNINISIA